MAKCNNCNTNLGCTCQVRTASDGRSVCSNCVKAYEAQLKLSNFLPNNNIKPEDLV